MCRFLDVIGHVFRKTQLIDGGIVVPLTAEGHFKHPSVAFHNFFVSFFHVWLFSSY